MKLLQFSLIPMFALALAGCGGGNKAETLQPGETLCVMASTPHLASLAMAIAGEDAKVDMLIAKSNFVVLKADFYDKSGSRLKEMKAGTVEKVEGRWVVRKLLMKNVQKGTKTLLTVESITYSPQPPLQSSMFTKESLKQ